MAFGGDNTKRQGMGDWLVVAVTYIGEFFGLLNKGSAKQPAGADAEDAKTVTNISSNSLNVTRVGLVGLIAGAGAAAVAIFNVDKGTDRAPVVVAAFASIGVIVAAALIAAAVIIASDIRARKDVAVASPSGSASAAASVTRLAVPADGHVKLDRIYDLVVIDASAESGDVTMPDATASPWRHVTLVRDDGRPDHNLVVQPVTNGGGQNVAKLAANDRLDLYSDNGGHWHRA